MSKRLTGGVRHASRVTEAENKNRNVTPKKRAKDKREILKDIHYCARDIVSTVQYNTAWTSVETSLHVASSCHNNEKSNILPMDLIVPLVCRCESRNNPKPQRT